MEAVRTAIEPAASIPVAEPTNPGRPVSADGDVPLALYEELKGVPYSSVYFEVKSLDDDENLGFGDTAKVIDRAYREKVQRGELQDGKDSYDAFIKEAIKATGSQHAPVGVKMAKVAEFVKFMTSLKKIDKELYG